MNDTTLSNNLHQLMRLHGILSVSDLARLTNLPQPTLHHILTGATKNPRKKLLATVANYFSITVEQLLGKEALPNIIPDVIKEDLQFSTIPIIQWDMLQDWPQSYSKDPRSKEIVLDKKISAHSFALLAQDALLEPVCPQNSLLIFDQGKKPADRDYVMVHMGRNNTVLLNRLFIDDNESYVKQNLEDGNVKLIKLDKNTDRVIGTLIEVRIQF